MASKRSSQAEGVSELSKVPSWIMLGFVVGGLFVLLLRREYISREVAEPVSIVTSADALKPQVRQKSLTELKGMPSLTAIENVWAVWGHHAIWEDDITEVALWNTEYGEFSDFFEVVRRGDHVFFRSIPRLTRPTVDRGLGKHSPLQFTQPPVEAKR